MSGKMKRTTSKKSHSWWWDSHISPKNSKWLAENLEDMDQSVKRMLKLIEEDGDSFAKKAEMYYQKRPELVSHVENFYRMYRSLAERYDHVTGELRKNIPSELHSQNSGSGSDFGSEPPSPSLSPSPERKPTRLKLKHRAPGFDFFLGSSGSSDHSRKEGDTSSESGSESDDASSNNHISSPAENGVGSGLHQRIIELEDELRDLKEKLCALEEEKADGMHKHAGKGDYGEFKAKISSLEEELLVANQKVRVSEEEIESLRREFENRDSDMTIGFQRELESAREGMKLEKKKTSELLERIVALEADVSDRDHTIEELKKAIADANENISKEKSWLQLELKGLSEKQAWLEADLGLLESRKTSLEDQITRLVEDKKEMQSSHEAREIEMSTEVESLKVENAERCKRIEELNKDLDAFKLEQDMLVAERDELNAKISALQAELHSNEAGMHSQIESAKAENAESCRHIEELNKDLDALKLKHNMLVAERDELNAKALALSADLSSREDKIRQMDDHLRGLHVEHVQLIAGSDGAKRVARELTGRVKELEVEVERLRVAVSEAAEEKREVIRQLCFSLDHFRDGYQQLRQALHGHKGSAVLAS